MKPPIRISILLHCLALVFLLNHFYTGTTIAWGQEEAVAVEIVEVDADGKTQEVELAEADEDDFADDDEEDVAAINNNPFGARMPDMLGAKKMVLEQEFRTELELITTVCEIDKKQQKKLGIAVRGAVKKQMASWRKKIFNGAGADDRDVEATVFEDASEIDSNILQSIQFSGGNPFQSTNATDSKFWRKSLRSTLTKEQLAAFKDYRIEESRLRKRKLIESTIATLAFELNLNKEKKQEFEKLVIPYLEREQFSAPALYEGYIVYYYASKTSKSKLKRILSKAQYQKWIIMMAPMKEIGQMIEPQENEQMEFAAGLSDVVDAVISVVDEVGEEVAKFFQNALGK